MKALLALSLALFSPLAFAAIAGGGGNILLIVSAICFFLAAVPAPWPHWDHVGWLGMFFAALAFII